MCHHKRLPNVTPSVTTAPSDSTEVFRYVRHADVPKFTAEGWELLPALDGTHHGYSVLMRRVEQSRRKQKQDRCVTNNSG